MEAALEPYEKENWIEKPLANKVMSREASAGRVTNSQVEKRMYALWRGSRVLCSVLPVLPTLLEASWEPPVKGRYPRRCAAGGEWDKDNGHR